MSSHMVEHLEFFLCPLCKGGLETTSNSVRCINCGKEYDVDNGIPLLFVANEQDQSRKDVTDEVKSFYEETPFPNYEDFEDIDDLIQKARKGVFAYLLSEQIPLDAKVLEVGCGTGQLSNFLGGSHRNVFGADMCLNSLRLANNFKNKNNLSKVGFYQMNLFKPIFKEESIDIVISIGVLHHTADPFGGFQSIAKLVKKGGYIIIGLYNKYGRVTTNIRRLIFNMTGDRFKFLDPRLRGDKVGDLRKLTWFKDQYKNPHESQHSMGEVLRWFEETGFDFVNSIPKPRVDEPFTRNERLFKSRPKGNLLECLLVQLKLIYTSNAEGGFYIMIGRKR
ncbi:methyltransferase domain-containing protein [Candidatus Omnitrophota bacterium]